MRLEQNSLAKIPISMPICAWITDWEPVKSFAHTYGTNGKYVDCLYIVIHCLLPKFINISVFRHLHLCPAI